mmetsp:Transcript_93082/g.277899  ORF Transcript_93082/g.277899 Transcript_93082/m.277899 type:complete len:223 (+) Transcript_93082:217-885(+)
MKMLTATTRKTPELKGASQLTSKMESEMRNGSSSAARASAVIWRAAEGVSKNMRMPANTASSIHSARPCLSSLRKPRLSCESKNCTQRCSCSAVRCALVMLSARRCFNSAYCAGLPFFRVSTAACSAPGAPARGSSRRRSSSRSTEPQAPPGRPGPEATVADCSAGPLRASPLSPPLSASSRSKPVGTRKEARRVGESERTPTINAASDSTGHCTCSAKIAM